LSTCSSPTRDSHSFPTRRSSDLTVSGPGYGPRLECSYNKSGIPPVPPRKLALTFPWLPPILYKLHEQSISSYSKAPRGLSVLSRSEEHTSELQSRFDLVCRLLLE